MQNHALSSRTKGRKTHNALLLSVLERYGVGQVLPHRPWLPPLRKQLTKAGGRFFNAGTQCSIRLLTPLGMRYDESYIQAYPFDKIVERMLQPGMILETVLVGLPENILI